MLLSIIHCNHIQSFHFLFDSTMPNVDEAEQFKEAGNKALQAGNLTSAIESYTKAINADGTNHVYYSNRSAAYLKQGDGNNALEDAISTIAINPGFSKGYSRKGGTSYSLFVFAYQSLLLPIAPQPQTHI